MLNSSEEETERNKEKRKRKKVLTQGEKLKIVVDVCSDVSGDNIASIENRVLSEYKATVALCQTMRGLENDYKALTIGQW